VEYFVKISLLRHQYSAVTHIFAHSGNLACNFLKIDDFILNNDNPVFAI